MSVMTTFLASSDVSRRAARAHAALSDAADMPADLDAQARPLGGLRIGGRRPSHRRR